MYYPISALLIECLILSVLDGKESYEGANDWIYIGYAVNDTADHILHDP